MKKSTMIATAATVLAAGAAVFYTLRRKRKSNTVSVSMHASPNGKGHNHHLTNLFANAKTHHA